MRDVRLRLLGRKDHGHEVTNPTQERFRLATYFLTDLAFQASGAEPLAWGEFIERYTAMYPRGQPGLPNDPMTAYMNDLRATRITSGTTIARRTPLTRSHDPMRECFFCMVLDSGSSSELELAPHHHTTNDQRWARLDEFAEARRQIDEELANLRRELEGDNSPLGP
jgi:hypothetical protein